MAAYATPNPSEEKKKMSSCSLKSIKAAIKRFENVSPCFCFIDALLSYVFCRLDSRQAVVPGDAEGAEEAAPHSLSGSPESEAWLE